METEPILLNAARKMDKEAIVKIFDLYATPLYNYALCLCRESLTADHIVGEVFARLLEQFASGKGPTSNLRSYLYGTAYHIIVDRALSLQRRAPLEALISLRPEVRSVLLSSEDQIMVGRVLDAIQNDLTDRQRHVIILRFLEKFSLQETAVILGKEASHVKGIQSRAIARLRRVFESKEVRVAALLPRIRELSKSTGI